MGKKDKGTPSEYFLGQESMKKGVDVDRLVALDNPFDSAESAGSMFEFPTGVSAPYETREIVRETVSAVHHREQEPGFLALQERDQDRQTRNLALAAAMRLTEDRSFLTVRVKDGETDEEFAERKDSEHNARVNAIFALAGRVHAFLTLDESLDVKSDV